MAFVESSMRKRIAIVSSSCPPEGAGGVSSAHYNLYRAIKRRGHEARMFTFGDYNVPSSGPDVTRAGTPPWFERSVLASTRAFFRLVEPGTLSYHVSEVIRVAWPCLRLRREIHRFKPDVLLLPDHCCPGLLIGKPAHCKVILVSHHNPARFLDNPLWRLHSKLDGRLTIMCENRVLRNVDTVVCPSEYMKEMFAKTYSYAGPLRVIPNLVDVELIASIPRRDIRRELRLPDDSLMVYIPSAGNIYKGSRYVCEIIRRLSSHTSKDLGFYLSGSLTPELSYELRYAPPNAKIYAPGHSSYADNIAIVKGCSFGVSPTLIESFGMTLLEASYCGVPMVTFNVGGNADVVCHGKSGFLVSYLDLESLIGAACRLMEGPYRESIRRETERHAREIFESDAAGEQYNRLMS